MAHKSVADIERILGFLPEAIKDAFGKGSQADYIPALAKVDPNRFGMAISMVDGGYVAVDGWSNKRPAIFSTRPAVVNASDSVSLRLQPK